VLTDCPLVALVATIDLERAAHFYGTVLGLEIVEQSPYAVVIEAAGTTLRVTLVEEISLAPYTVLGWLVDDLDGELTRLRELGVEPLRYQGMAQDEAGAWTAPGGARIAWFNDPDGNTLSLTSL
jgi:catechol 2,3-dioxygenase-like lactoylglutathione lyase family enzyme